MASNQLTIINVKGKNYGIKKVSVCLAKLSGGQIFNFFLNRKIKLKRSIRMEALKKVISRIEEVNHVHMIDLNNSFEIELELYLEKLGIESYYNEYKEALFEEIIGSEELHITEDELDALMNLKPESVEKFKLYETKINEITYDDFGYFDGQPIDKFEERLISLNDFNIVNTIMYKYGFNLHLRLKKNLILNNINFFMKENDIFDVELFDKLSRKSTLGIEKYLIENDLLSLEYQRINVVAAKIKDEILTYNYNVLDKPEIDTYIDTPFEEELIKEDIKTDDNYDYFEPKEKQEIVMPKLLEDLALNQETQMVENKEIVESKQKTKSTKKLAIVLMLVLVLILALLLLTK